MSFYDPTGRPKITVSRPAPQWAASTWGPYFDAMFPPHLYGRIDTKSPTVYSSMVHVAGGEEGSTSHDDEMTGPAPRVDLAQAQP